VFRGDEVQRTRRLSVSAGGRACASRDGALCEVVRINAYNWGLHRRTESVITVLV
jgi:hypothetical protein